MLKKIFSYFKPKEPEPVQRETFIELSKIDKHMNFILRDKLGIMNRVINEKVVEINESKEEIIHRLRMLHKSALMNPNISQREIQIMEGNREHYVKMLSHFVTNIEIPKNYLESYDYCTRFSSELGQLHKDVEKNIFVLNNFFENEIRAIGKELSRLQQLIMELKSTFDNNNIDVLKRIQEKIKGVTKNIIRIKSLDEEIKENKESISIHNEKLKKLNERIATITSGADFRMLESFREEKAKADEELKKKLKELEHYFSEIENALKKYFYRNPDKKLLRAYFDNFQAAFTNDHALEFASIISDLKRNVEDNVIELKDKKRESTLEALSVLSPEYLKASQSELKFLESERQRVQTKITHNSASLNMSEQQYWMNATEDKVKHHQSIIDKLQRDINKIKSDNEDIKSDIQEGLERIMGEKILIKDDLEEQLEPIMEKETK